MGRSGSVSHNGSGDIFLAFSTANEEAVAADEGLPAASFVPDAKINPLFTAVVQSIDEAILNSLIANKTMVGRDDREVIALPARRPLRRAQGVWAAELIANRRRRD